MAEHFDVLRFRRFIFVFRESFFVSGDFCAGRSSNAFGFISFAGGAIVIRGNGDFLWIDSGSCSSGGRFGGLSKTGDLDRSDFGEEDLLLQFLSQRSGVMRLEEDEAFTRCGLRSRCACVSRQNMCILYWLRHLSEQNCSCVAPSWNKKLN